MAYWKYADWIENIPNLKSIMDKNRTYENSNKDVEKEYQQLVLRKNNFSATSEETDYFIADLEYQIPGSRFDMIAVKWPENERERNDKIQLALVEVKYGDVALSNLQKHIDDWCHYLQNKKKWHGLQDEMKNVFLQKMALGLMPHAPSNIYSFSSELPKLLLLTANIDYTNSTLLRALKSVACSESYKTLQSQECDVKIAVVQHNEYELYENRFIPLKQYLEQYSDFRSASSHTIPTAKRELLKGTNLDKFSEWAKRTELDTTVAELLAMLFTFADKHGLTTNFPNGFSLNTKNGLPLMWDYAGDVKGTRKLMPQLSRLSNSLRKMNATVNPNIVCSEFVNVLQTWHISKNSTEEQMKRLIATIKRLDERIQEVYFS
jgi:hypothetical protein